MEGLALSPMHHNSHGIEYGKRDAVANLTIAAIVTPIAVTLMALAFICSLIFCCRGKTYNWQQDMSNNVDSTNEERPRPKKLRWLLWTLLALTILGLLIGLGFLIWNFMGFRHRHLERKLEKNSEPPTIIPTIPSLQLDYNGTTWASGFTKAPDHVFIREIEVPKATFLPTFHLKEYILEVLDPRTQFKLSPPSKDNTTFWAPALKCKSANESVIANATRRFGKDITSDSGHYTNYTAWVPGDSYASNWSAASLAGTFGYPLQTIDNQSPDTKRIFVMTNSNDLYKTAGKDAKPHLRAVNVTECSLGNASLTFNFVDGSVSVSKWSLPFMYDKLTEKTSNELASYTALMNDFGSILVGQTGLGESPDEMTGVIDPSWKRLKVDWTSAEEVQRGLEKAFQNITIGLLSDPDLTKVVTN